MSFNPMYRRWTRDNWQGYAPTIGRMHDRGWSVSAHCQECRLAMLVDLELLRRKLGNDWSPWGRTARCRRMYCHGRMRLKAYTGGLAETEIDL